MNNTGSSSRIEAFSSPFASAGVLGATTFRPGTCANHASRLCECCDPAPRPTPCCTRTTIGALSWLPNRSLPTCQGCGVNVREDLVEASRRAALGELDRACDLVRHRTFHLVVPLISDP